MRGRLLIILMLITGMVQGGKITVGPTDEDFPQIQMAIDNSNNGDVIEVHSGTYPERLNVFKTVTLIGVDAGDGLPVINANGLGSAITLIAPGSTVKGFNLTGSTGCPCSRNAGIQIASSNNTIIDNVIYRNKYGIYVQQGYVNNTLISNDLLENQIAARDQGGNYWNSSSKKIRRITEICGFNHWKSGEGKSL